MTCVLSIGSFVMRCSVLQYGKRSLLKVSSLSVLGALVAGCSSGFERFDSYYDSVAPQQASAPASNPYPQTIDPTTTASTGGRRFAPLANVTPQQDPQAVYHKPEPTYASKPQPSYYTPTQPSVATQYNQPVRKTLDGYNSNPSSTWKQTKSVSSSSLKPVASAPAKPVYIAPKPAKVAYSPRAANTDKFTTASVKPAPVAKPVIKPVAKPVVKSVAAVQPSTNRVSAAPQSRQEDGWTTTGGTTIKVRNGETLYNLSKRYGVPVSEIRKANNMSSSEHIKVGQAVLIPNYVFSPSSPISAPDSDAGTRAARASTGYVGEANQARVPVPTPRQMRTAALSTGGVSSSADQRYQPRQIVAPPSEKKVPDYGVTTSSNQTNDGFYTVKSGDSLSKIAAVTGASVKSLQAANGIIGTGIKIGQKLVVPTGNSAPSTTIAQAPKSVDRTTTASIAKVKKDDAPAPARTGISDFRWPVEGRIVQGFGTKNAGGKNEGIDISVPEGTAVKAAENGVVIYAGSEISSYGNLILVRHTDGWVSAYAHNRNFEIKKGDKVRRGQIIARSGRTGEADRPKLHFELRKNSVPVNPTDHLAGA